MKKINSTMSFVISVLLLTASCTQSSNQSIASSNDIKKACGFKVLVFSSYTDEKDKMVYDYEEMESWSKEGSHHYAVENSSNIKSAHAEILKGDKTLKKVVLSFNKAGSKLIQLDDKDIIRKSLREMGELKPKMSLRFVFKTKSKETCKKDIEIFVE